MDHFGNLLTNIAEEDIRNIQGKENKTLTITIKNKIISSITMSYANSVSGELLAVIGSRGFLEISVNQGSAAASLGTEIGDTVTIAVKKV